MTGRIRGIALALVVVLAAVNLVISRPLVTLPTPGGWQLTLPWAVTRALASHSWNPNERAFETMVKVGIAVELARRTIANLERLVADQLGRAVRDFADGVRRGIEERRTRSRRDP